MGHPLPHGRNRRLAWRPPSADFADIRSSHTDWAAKRLDVALTKKQVENSPDIDTHQPVSRQHEAAYLGYYGYPYYWGGPYLWGPAFYPAGLADSQTASAEAMADRIRRESTDSHLRSTEAVTGYNIEATDGEIGHVDGFVVDDEAWAIRYIEVATRNWWPGKKVLVSPAWIERVSWADSKSTSASPGKPSRTARSTSSPRRSLESMKTGSISTTAGRHTGWTKPNTRSAVLLRVDFKLSAWVSGDAGCGGPYHRDAGPGKERN